jgi:N-acetyl-gamma-glutamylphosphate reductase
MECLFMEMNKQSMCAPVGIVGFRGYSGAESVKILQRHSFAEPALFEHRSDSGERPAAARPCRAEAHPVESGRS